MSKRHRWKTETERPQKITTWQFINGSVDNDIINTVSFENANKQNGQRHVL